MLVRGRFVFQPFFQVVKDILSLIGQGQIYLFPTHGRAYTVHHLCPLEQSPSRL